MKINFKYGDRVICLPEKAVSERLPDATRDELCVLLALAIDGQSHKEDPGFIDRICEKTGISHEDFMKSVSFWRGSGALSVILEEDEKLPAARKKGKAVKAAKSTEDNAGNDAAPKRKIMQSPSIPPYSTEQIADFLEDDDSLRSFVDECQQMMGKIFSSGEASTLISVVKYLGVGTDYVALLCAYAVGCGKKSVRYVERLAIELYDDGVTKYIELEERLRSMNEVEKALPAIRRMMGLGERALTTKEREFISKWCGEMEFDLPVIKKAYEIAANNTGKASMPYINTVLESWYSAGLRTVEQIDAAMAEREKSKKNGRGSFETDDFFSAALNRSYNSPKKEA